MIFFTQIHKAQIEDSAGRVVGKLDDLVFRPAAPYPVAAGLLLKKNKKEFFAPFKEIESFGPWEITLNIPEEKLGISGEKMDNTFRATEILDKQIVDIKGARVVRVNDLQIAKTGEDLSLLGVDVSTWGLLRRLGLGWWKWLRHRQIQSIGWGDMHLVNGPSKYLQLSTTSREVVKLHPSDIANIIEDLKAKQGSELLKSLDAKTAAKVFEEVDDQWQVQMAEHLTVEESLQLIGKMTADQIVDFIKNFSARGKAEKMINSLPPDKAAAVKKLLQFRNNTAGGLMALDYLVLNINNTAAEAVEKIKNSKDNLNSVLFIYLVDDLYKLRGIVSLRSIMIAAGEIKLKEIMRKPIATIRANDSVEKIAKIFAKYNLVSAAVVDKEKKLLGVVKVDDLIGELVKDY